MQRCIHAVVQLAAQITLLSLSTSFPYAQTEKPRDLPSLGQIANVVCAGDPGQSYALYLPSAYTSAKRWPIVYFFDPGGRGRRPLDLYQNLAEKYGFIFVGSNNSRNFASDQSQSVNAVWQDAHLRFSLDEHRMYASGFSGGARIAGAMGLSCPTCGIAGVIAHGAGYPNNMHGSSDKLSYFFAVGNQDFNWPEVITIRREREKQRLPYRVRVFSGSHQWAPYAVMEDAMQWLQLRAMQAGITPADPAFIDQQLQQRQKEADDAERTNDLLEEFQAYRSLAYDFVGLRDVKAASAKLATLEQSSALKAALNNEQSQIAEQMSIEREISPKLHAYEDGAAPDLTALRLEILQALAGLKDRAARSKNEVSRLIFSRAFNDMLVEGIESGQQELEARHFDKAESCFDLMKQISDDPWPVLLLADTHAASGNKKLAIKDLREAIRRGLKDVEAIESDRHLQVLKADPEFEKLVSGLKGK